MSEKILFVDDDVNLLSALKRQFRKVYDVTIAPGGADGIRMIKEEGPFAVIISDMQMPEMNGIQFLQAAQKLAPDSVRLMLTGNADQKTAVDAVNEGSVLSFYSKPCSNEVMTLAIDKALEHYRLITAERELLEGTLNGAVKLLLDMLSMIAPDAFGKTMAIKEMAIKLAQSMEIEDTWHLELAAMLSNIACITLPPETLAKTFTNEALSSQENLMISRLPEVAFNLICNIPRLEKVAQIVLYQNKLFSGGGFPKDKCAGEDIPYESRILKIIHDMEKYKSEGYTVEQSIKSMAADTGIYDPDLLAAMKGVFCANQDQNPSNVPVTTSLRGLQAGNILASNIESMDGKVLFAAGHKITSTIIERLLNYNQITKIKEPIHVIIEEQSDNPDANLAAAN